MGRVIDIANEDLQGDAAEGRAGSAFQCLDVWNLRQGELRLWLYSSVVGYLVLVSIYWQVWELLCLSVENIDTRDIVDDYRLSHAGVHSWHADHWQANRPNLELSVSDVDHACGQGTLANQPCTANSQTDHTDDDPNMIDPRFQAIYESNLRLNFMQPSDTGYDYEITAYEYTLDLASTAAVYKTVSTIIDVEEADAPDCVGCHPVSLPLYHHEYTERSKVSPRKTSLSNQVPPHFLLASCRSFLHTFSACVLLLISGVVSGMLADRGAVSRKSCGGSCVVWRPLSSAAGAGHVQQ